LNTTGAVNTAQGNSALFNNSTGKRNVAVGINALFDNTVGYSNTAIGAYAGRRITGNDNIAVANIGVAGESQTMRLGTQGSAGVINSGVTRTFIAGISGVTTSRAGTSERLLQLRPVTFRYKQPDAADEQPIQYGLIAEEVAEVFPELVVPNEDGQPETVAYHLLPALLLNEVQKDRHVIQAQAEQLETLRRDTETQAIRMAALEQQVAVLAKAMDPMAKDQMVASAR
jgi:hypothetical protein